MTWKLFSSTGKVVNNLKLRGNMKPRRDIVTGNNCLGYEFECGCMMDLKDGLDLVRKRKNVVCPIHGCKWIKKIMVCFECGRIFKVESKRIVPRCGPCRLDHRRSRIRNAHAKRQDNGVIYKTAVSEKKKPIIDQTRRYECVHGDGCMNAECFRNVKFNCHNCKRFEKLERFSDIYSKENERYIYA